MKKNNYLKKFSLKGKVAIVLGGFGLMGLEISKALSDAGAKVVILDLKEKRKIHKSTFIKFDCKNYEHFEKILKLINRKIGFPEIYINASYPASDDWALNTFKDISLDSFKENIDLHLNSFVFMAKIFADFLKNSKRKGSLIQISSTYGLVAQNMSVYAGTRAKDNMTYPVIKGGITHFSKQLASYYGKYQIRVNNICPGGIEGKFKGTNKKFDHKFSKKYKDQTLLKRFCKPEDVASAALFLASDASSYVTGTSLIVDGGWTAI